MYQVNFIALQRKKDPEQVLLQCVPKHKVWSGLHCLAPELPGPPFVGCKGSSVPNGPVHCPGVMAELCCHHTVVVWYWLELGEEGKLILYSGGCCAVISSPVNLEDLAATISWAAITGHVHAGKHEAKHVGLNFSQRYYTVNLSLVWHGLVVWGEALLCFQLEWLEMVLFPMFLTVYHPSSGTEHTSPP